MLRLYRRHRRICPHRSERHRRCSCPIYVEGSLAGEAIRRTLDLTSWEGATLTVRSWEAAGRIGGAYVEVPRIEEAVERFLADCQARNLAEATIRRCRNLFRNHLVRPCEEAGYRELKQLNVSVMRGLRQQWRLAPRTQQKHIETLRSFFRFCEASEWIVKNPMAGIKPPKIVESPTLPLEDGEFERLVRATQRFRGDGQKLRALLLTLRYSGLRISDAAALTRDRLLNDRLFLYQQKTGTPVWVPLPEFVLTELRLRARHRTHLFWSGEGKLASAIGDLRRGMLSIARAAKVEHFHFHRLRDSFAVSLLERGVEIETVAVLLGHNSSAVTRKHYNPWVKSRQAALEVAVRKSWNAVSS